MLMTTVLYLLKSSTWLALSFCNLLLIPNRDQSINLTVLRPKNCAIQDIKEGSVSIEIDDTPGR